MKSASSKVLSNGSYLLSMECTIHMAYCISLHAVAHNNVLKFAGNLNSMSAYVKKNSSGQTADSSPYFAFAVFPINCK